MKDALFLYGPLLHQPLFDVIAGPGDGQARMMRATLRDHRVESRADGPEPMLVAQDGAVADGVVWRGLTADQRRRLDAHELPYGRTARPVIVTRADGTRGMAMAHIDGATQAHTGLAWSLAEWVRLSAAASLAVAAELARHDPPLEGASLLRQWPMIRGRAQAQLRAQAAPVVAQVRRAAAPQDFSVTHAGPLRGAFFKLDGLLVAHAKVGGGMSDVLPREVLVGADAALVLPYDPVRDRVLLVEQFRPAPARRGDRNPWTLEPVAGMVDAGETPEDAARRETLEEAHATLDALHLMFRVYASPGSTTDYFHCYLGLCDLPDGHATQGGLAEEQEDLALHLLSFDAALALVDSGEATAGPLVAMLLWLARHRAGFRALEFAGTRP